MEVRLFLNQKKGDLEEYKYQSLPSKEKFLLNFNSFFFFFDLKKFQAPTLIPLSLIFL